MRQLVDAALGTAGHDSGAGAPAPAAPAPAALAPAPGAPAAPGASWLLSGVKLSADDALLSGVGFMGVCSRNPDVYNAPVPIHAHVFRRGVAHIDADRLERLRRSRFNLPATSLRLPAGAATTAPRSRIWTPVAPSAPAPVSGGEYWSQPPTGII
jgi:hypothetical protein